MNFISRLFKKKSTNPLLEKLYNCLKRQYPEIKVRNASFLFGTPYSENTLTDIKNAIAKNELDVFRKNAVLYDVRIDNIELYLLEKEDNQFCIVLLLDGYELYSREEILEILPVKMINIEKIQIYKKYNGEIDSWARFGSKREQLNINDNDWYLIEQLIQDILLVNRNLVSLKYKNELNDKLTKICVDSETIELLKSISN